MSNSMLTSIKPTSIHRTCLGRMNRPQQINVRFRNMYGGCTPVANSFVGAGARSTICNVHNCYSHAAKMNKCTHEVLIPMYVVDGPCDEYQKDATTTNFEPTDVQVSGNIPCQILVVFACDVGPCIDACICNNFLGPVHSMAAFQKLMCIVFRTSQLGVVDRPMPAAEACDM